jgi:hypothetical protein
MRLTLRYTSGDGRSRHVTRRAFDFTEAWSKARNRWEQHAWIRYRGGRLFVRRYSWDDGRFGWAWTDWAPYAVEPKRGNAWAIAPVWEDDACDS